MKLQINADALLKPFTSDDMLQNILYNLGYMYTDIFVLVRNDERTKPDYAYFLFRVIGDFLMRFLYRDPTP